MMEIGLFQLENLTLSRARYTLLNLSSGDEIPPRLGRVLEGSVRVSRDELQRIEALAPEKDFPLILVCESGKTSAAVAAALEARGYSNVYVVEGGTDGLLAEL